MSSLEVWGIYTTDNRLCFTRIKNPKWLENNDNNTLLNCSYVRKFFASMESTDGIVKQESSSVWNLLYYG